MDKQFDHQQIDEIITSRIRLAVMAVLSTVDEIDFTSLCNEVNATRGNLSVHLKKLEEGKYIRISKEFVDNKPLTTIKVTKKGIEAFSSYLNMVEQFAVGRNNK